MAEVIRYVDTDATGSGTGLDWENAYTSLYDWQAAEATDLVAAGNWHHVYCRASSGTVDTAAIIISGWTTAEANNIVIEAAEGDEALKSGWDTSRYNANLAQYFTLSVPYVTVKNIQIESPIHANNGDYCNISGCRIDSSNNFAFYLAASNINIYNCIIQGRGNKTIFIPSVKENINIYNCIVLSETNSPIEYAAGTGGVVKNTACYSFTSADDFNIDDSAAVAIDYCAGKDGTGTNPVYFSGGDWNNEFVDPANGDFTLLDSGNLFHGGSSAPDPTLYTTDMEGDDYNVDAYSIGVDEIETSITYLLEGSLNSASHISGGIIGNIPLPFSATLTEDKITGVIL